MLLVGVVLGVVTVCFFGAAAWLVTARPDRRRRTLRSWPLEGAPSFSPQEALRRHPAGRAVDPDVEASPGPGALRAGEAPHRPTGPDDDPEFLQELARRIRGHGQGHGA